MTTAYYYSFQDFKNLDFSVYDYSEEQNSILCQSAGLTRSMAKFEFSNDQETLSEHLVEIDCIFIKHCEILRQPKVFRPVEPIDDSMINVNDQESNVKTFVVYSTSEVDMETLENIDFYLYLGNIIPIAYGYSDGKWFVFAEHQLSDPNLDLESSDSDQENGEFNPNAICSCFAEECGLFNDRNVDVQLNISFNGHNPGSFACKLKKDVDLLMKGYELSQEFVRPAVATAYVVRPVVATAYVVRPVVATAYVVEPTINLYSEEEIEQQVQLPDISEDGTEKYYQEGKLHRNGDQPAVIMSDGSTKYYQDGKLHRPSLNGPAVIMSDGTTQKYYQNGYLHRPDNEGPAVIMSDGTQKYYLYGKLHREGDQPAGIMSDGTQKYYQDGKLHRHHTYGPAIVYCTGKQEYYFEGELHRPKNNGPAVINPSHSKSWFEYGTFLKGVSA
ncbi:MAG: hypothetical protein JKX76_02205 [Colwellia sp.]|nr:hypothetical protein [Colwellia sp.]